MQRSPGSSSIQQQQQHHRVVFGGGLLVRRGPDFGAETTGNTIPPETIFMSTETIDKPDGSRFLRLADGGGWVVARKGQLLAAETFSMARTLLGPFYYKVVHPSGARFAISAEVSASANRHEVTHALGKVLVANEKRMDAGSHVAIVQLENSQGWIFENARTGEVLDRLGDEPIVCPIDAVEAQSIFQGEIADTETHERWYRVVYPSGIRLRSGPNM
jgi:hypothetical protein